MTSSVSNRLRSLRWLRCACLVIHLGLVIGAGVSYYASLPHEVTVILAMASILALISVQVCSAVVGATARQVVPFDPDVPPPPVA
jgi:hypothetical protein